MVEAYINIYRHGTLVELKEAINNQSTYMILCGMLKYKGTVEPIVDEMKDDIQTRFRGYASKVCSLIKANKCKGVFLVVCDTEEEAEYTKKELKGYDIDIEVDTWGQ